MFEKFSRYVGVQGILALLLISGALTLALTNRPVPAALENLSYAVAGFYFGSKGSSLAAQFTAWAWFAVPEWRKDRANLKKAVDLLGDIGRRQGVRLEMDEISEIESLLAEVYS